MVHDMISEPILHFMLGHHQISSLTNFTLQMFMLWQEGYVLESHIEQRYGLDNVYKYLSNPLPMC